MEKPTIYEIKQNTFGTSPYFFSPKTLKFFGQTLKSFKVVQSPTGRIFIYAAMRDYNHNLMGYTFREYTGSNLITVRDNADNMFYEHGINDILSFINTH